MIVSHANKSLNFKVEIIQSFPFLIFNKFIHSFVHSMGKGVGKCHFTLLLYTLSRVQKQVCN